MKKAIAVLCMIILTVMCVGIVMADDTEAGEYGTLRVEGTALVDADGNPVQLKGLSTHGLAWFPQYVNQECIAYFKENWGINLIRLAMYTAENGGYCTDGDRQQLLELIDTGVQAAVSLDMYVIIDWHILSDGNPLTYLDEATGFFNTISEKYSGCGNVLYEICNEPNGGTSWADVKSYAEQIIPIIRTNSPDAIVIIGTPNWCQYVDQAAADPITDYDNIMYSLHFYAATHKDDLRNTMLAALDAGLPIFVTEFGICDASGSGGIDRIESEKWLDLLDNYGISYSAWSISNKDETASILRSDCSKSSGFELEDFSESGLWLYSRYTGRQSADASTLDNSLETQTNDQQTDIQKGNISENDAPAADMPGTAEEYVSGDIAESEEANPDDSTSDFELISVSAVGVSEKFEVLDSVEAVLKLENSWEANGEYFRQYSVTVINNSSVYIYAWKVKLEFSDNIKLSSQVLNCV